MRVRENFDPTVIGREGWVLAWIVEGTPPPPPAPGAIQMPYNIRGEKREQVMEWLRQRGVADQRILVDVQTRERIPEVFDSFQPDQVVSSVPPEGEWIMPEGQVTLGSEGRESAVPLADRERRHGADPGQPRLDLLDPIGWEGLSSNAGLAPRAAGSARVGRLSSATTAGSDGSVRRARSYWRLVTCSPPTK